jgi:hypothetical protein
MTALAKIEQFLLEKIGDEASVYADPDLFHPHAQSFFCDRTDERHFDGTTETPLYETQTEDGDIAYRIERDGNVLIFVQIGTDADGYACNVSGQAILCEKGTPEEAAFTRAALKFIFTQLVAPVSLALRELNEAASNLGLSVSEFKPMLAQTLGL